MKQLPSARFNAQSADDILAYLTKSATEQSSESINQGIALHVLDSKRPANSGTLKKYVLSKGVAAIRDHAFSVAVAFGSLNGTGTGHVEEETFVKIPLTWHLHASAIVNLVAKPEAGLDDAGRAAVHEEVCAIYRNRPEKAEDMLKMIKGRFKKAGSKATEANKTTANADGSANAPVPGASVVVDALSDAYLKAIGFQATECADKEKLARAVALLDYIRANVLAPKCEELGITEIPSLAAPAPVEAPTAIDVELAKEVAELQQVA